MYEKVGQTEVMVACVFMILIIAAVHDIAILCAKHKEQKRRRAQP